MFWNSYAEARLCLELLSWNNALKTRFLRSFLFWLYCPKIIFSYLFLNQKSIKDMWRKQLSRNRSLTRFFLIDEQKTFPWPRGSPSNSTQYYIMAVLLRIIAVYGVN